MKLIAKKKIDGSKLERFDLHVKNTHNFVAEGIVVHNTNCRVGIIEGEPMAGSMELRRKMPETEKDRETNTYWFPWTLNPVGMMLNAYGLAYKQVILFGEVYGAKVQKGYSYDSTTGYVGFRAFDLLIEGRYLNHDDFVAQCEHFGVEIAPVLYKGPFSLPAIKSVADGPTTVGEGHIREGVVVRPMAERRHPSVGRLVMKYVGDDYLLSKHPDSKDV